MKSISLFLFLLPNSWYNVHIICLYSILNEMPSLCAINVVEYSVLVGSSSFFFLFPGQWYFNGVDCWEWTAWISLHSKKKLQWYKFGLSNYCNNLILEFQEFQEFQEFLMEINTYLHNIVMSKYDRLLCDFHSKLVYFSMIYLFFHTKY